jgi:HAD superfamily hydrolase (TIGR01509 family)
MTRDALSPIHLHMNDPQAVIFDVDGLLVDTETCDYDAWRELYARHGMELTLDEYCHDAGLYGTWERRYAALAERCGLTAAELNAWREPRFRERVGRLLRPTPKLEALLDTLERHGIRRGIASSSDADWVGFLLDGLGVRGRFEALATGFDVEHRKPAPDLYLLAAARLGVDPRRSVALEDSAHGIQAAKAAGLRVIAIPNSVSARQDLSLADMRVDHLREVTPDLLRKLMG